MNKAKEMNDKELVKTFKNCAHGGASACRDCKYKLGGTRCNMKKLYEDVVALINRLQSENERLKKANESLSKEYKDQVALNKLTLVDMDDLMAQLERRVEDVYPEFMQDYKTMRDELNACYEENGKLKELNAKYLDSIESVQAGRCRLRCELTEQAVKDTAKEILTELIERAHSNGCIDLTVNEVKAWFREDYGVEVE